MRVFGSYAIVYLVAGSGFYRDGRGVQAKVSPGDAILIFPEIPHRYGPGRGEDWEEIYLCFNGPLFQTWREEGVMDPARPIHHAAPIDVWYPRLRAMAEEPRPSTPMEHLDQLGRLTSLLAGLVSPPAEPENEPHWLSEAKGLLASNLEAELDWESVAKTLGMTYENFRKSFAAAVGEPPARYRSQRRMEAAKSLLFRNELTQAAIANSLGFHDEFHFSKRFKEMVGVSPREWRKLAGG